MTWQTVKDNGISLQFPMGGTESLRVVFDPNGFDIAYVVPDQRDQGNSNAAMIAAAPDLFNACRKLWDAVLEDCGRHDIPVDVLIAAFECRRAVVKAMGGHSYKHTLGAEQWAAKRRQQNRVRQRRCRSRKNAQKEATDGR